MEILFNIIVVFFVTSKVQIVIITTDFGITQNLINNNKIFTTFVTSLRCIKLFLTCAIFICVYHTILKKAAHNILLTAC